MIHLTLNTGHRAELPAGLVWPETRTLLAPIITAGRGKLPGQASAYRVEIIREPGSALFTFFRGPEPLSTNGLALTAAAAPEMWQLLESQWLALGDVLPGAADMGRGPPEMPTSAPWLATLLWPSLLTGTARQDIGFIGHMAACFGLLITEEK